MDDNLVAVLIEDLQPQFRSFGEGLQLLNDKVDRVETKVDNLDKKLDTHIEENRRDVGQNRQEHQQLMQMIKELDTEVIQ
jgi:predicted RNase H-like nuclease (RuvC/YqgF family)